MALTISQNDYDRIKENFERSYKYHIDHDEPLMAAKVCIITLRDLWISAHEFKWKNRRRAFDRDITKFNFESKVKDTIRNL